MVKPPLRTKSIGFKVSEEEYAQLETAAQADGYSQDCATFVPASLARRTHSPRLRPSSLCCCSK